MGKKDFAKSWEQRKWEFALSAYDRAKAALAALDKVGACFRGDLEKHRKYWQDSIDRVKKEYPGKFQ